MSNKVIEEASHLETDIIKIPVKVEVLKTIKVPIKSLPKLMGQIP